MSMHRGCMPQFRQMLLNLRAWLEEAEALWKERGRDPDSLLPLRLADDQFSLVQQVQIACDTAKKTAARLTGAEAPVHDDSEETLAELYRRIEETIAFLDTLEEADFAGAEDRLVVLPFNTSRASRGEDYLHEFALPNFYFHLVTAYSILRHEGVPLGKQTYLGRLTTRPAE